MDMKIMAKDIWMTEHLFFELVIVHKDAFFEFHQDPVAGNDGRCVFSLKPSTSVIDMLITVFFDSRSTGRLVLLPEPGSAGHETLCRMPRGLQAVR